MKCTRVRVGEITATICGSQRIPVCVKCGGIATRECDWRIGRRTCDRPVCDECTHSPAPGKDLCPRHAKEWANHPRQKQQALLLDKGAQ